MAGKPKTRRRLASRPFTRNYRPPPKPSRSCALSAIAVRVSRHRDRFQLQGDQSCHVAHPASDGGLV